MNRKLLRRSLAAFALALVGTAPAMAQDRYPTKPIRIVVPYPPGGALDVTTRLVGQKMTEKLGQPFIVENRAGGDTILGTGIVKNAPADGYTILSQSNGFSSAPALKREPGFDPLKDFTPIGPMVRGPIIVEVGGEQPDRTLKDFIARAKTASLTYASPGVGTAPHFAAAMMLNKLGIDVLHVPYKGAAAAYQDVLTGRVDMFFDGYAGSAPFIKSGKFRALASTGPSRLSNLPDVPTLVEQGIDVTHLYWFGLIVKAGTPREVVERLSEALRYATGDKELNNRFRADGVDPSFMSPADFREFIATEVAQLARLAAELKLPKE